MYRIRCGKKDIEISEIDDKIHITKSDKDNKDNNIKNNNIQIHNNIEGVKDTWSITPELNNFDVITSSVQVTSDIELKTIHDCSSLIKNCYPSISMFEL